MTAERTHSLFKSNENDTRDQNIILTPDHPFYDLVMARRRQNNDIIRFNFNISATPGEIQQAEKDLVKYIANLKKNQKPAPNPMVYENNIFVPNYPNDKFRSEFNQLISRNYKFINVHINSDTDFTDTTYDKTLKLFKQAQRKNIFITTILNGREISGKPLELSLQTPPQFREITDGSLISVRLNFIDNTQTQDKADMLIAANDKIFEFYEKHGAVQIANLLREREKMVAHYFDQKIRATFAAELKRNNGDCQSIDINALKEKTPNLFMDDLINSCNVSLNAAQCVKYGLFAKIHQKQGK